MLRLNNPAQERRLTEILESMPDDKKTTLVDHISRLERTLERRNKTDADLADALMRILKSPLGKDLRTKIKEIANNA